MIGDLGGLQFFYIPSRRIGAEEIKAIIKKKKKRHALYNAFIFPLLCDC